MPQYRDSDGFNKFSGDRNVDAVLIGTKWTGTTLTFSFPDTGDDYQPRYDFGQALRHVEFNDAQKAAARDAFAMISGYTGITFVEVPADSAERPTFRLSSTSLPDVSSAMGYFPHTNGDLGGDIWFGRSDQPYYETPQRGNWGYATMLHEVGHTMGLKHGHSDYTDQDLGSFLGLNRPFYGTRALEYGRDGQAWSLMSYTSAPGTADAFNGESMNQPQTYMMYDIAALQYLYGANYATNASDSVYRWDSATGTMSINGVSGKTPAGSKVFETIWDGGGIDTYDLGNYAGNLSIDLSPGALSTISTAQLANALAFEGGDAPQSGNIANALLYKGDVASLIENAIGGTGNDRISGNQVANRLDGGAGNDWLSGGAGSDLLIGGTGNDVADFSGAISGISITLNNDVADIVVVNGGDRDVLRGIEGAVGTAFNDTLVGDRLDNTLSGGAGGSDYLNGGDGNDTLIGAADTIVQVDKAVIAKPVDVGNHTRDSAIALDGAFDLVEDTLVERSQELPHASVDATGRGGAVDYYRITAKAGASAIFDIDGAPPAATTIQILDADGDVVAANYGVSQGDAGSRDGGSPLLRYVFQSSGTFFVRVGGLGYDYKPDGSSLPTLGGFSDDTDYILNVSLENAAVQSNVLAKGAGRFYGGAGDDTIFAASGDDLISGGAGIDTVSYAQARNGVTVNLAITRAQDTGAGKDMIGGIENLTGSAFDDVLSGNAGDNVLNGGSGGADRLAGGEGKDTLSFAGQTRSVSFDLGRQGQVQDAFLGGTVLASGFEHLEGGRGDDDLTGDAGYNLVKGGAGNDTLSGSGAGVTGVMDTLDGGEGFDTASFRSYGISVHARLLGNGRGVATTVAGGPLATLVGIEALAGGWGNDTLTGDGTANRLDGGDGSDRLDGGAGDDTLVGGWGDDRIVGGSGIDTAVYGGWGDYRVDLSITAAQETGDGVDVLSGIENLRGGFGSDSLLGDARDNVFFDVAGDDLYVGRAGRDTVDYSTVTSLLLVDLSWRGQQDTAAAGKDLLDGIEDVVGGDHGNLLRGNGAGNRLVGGSAIDVLFGGLGADRLEGGDGNDLLVGEDSGRTANSDNLSLDDVLIGGRGNDRLVGGEGNDTLLGGAGNDTLINGGVVLQQNGNNFSIDGLLLMDGGQDTLDGGEGDDYGALFYAGRKEAIRIDNRDTQATNAILFDGVAHGSLTGIEALRFHGGANGDHVETGAGYDLLQGEGGDDYLSSGQGDDTLIGGEGDDWIDGGEGVDMVSYAGAASGVTVDLRRTDAQDTGGAGIDTLRNVENLTPTDFTDIVHGNDASNTIRDYGGGDDMIFGHGGSDSIGVFRQEGKPEQTIYLDGGEGSDIVEYASAPTFNRVLPPEYYHQLDTVTLIGGAGRDGIYMSGQKIGVIDAGDGDDEVTIGMGGIVDTSVDITLGSGKDLLIIGKTDNYLSTIDRLGNIVRDFDVADDRMNLTGLLGSWETDDNPFTVGQLALVQSGDDVLLRIDPDRDGAFFDWHTMLVFENTRAADFTAGNFFKTDRDGVNEVAWDPHGATPLAIDALYMDPSGAFADELAYNRIMDNHWLA